MSNPLCDLTPQSVWRYFDKIRQIPHGSGNEKALGEAILQWATENGCARKRDDKGNVAIFVPASTGAEAAPILVLQSHMDMVCEKDKDCSFDFSRNAIEVRQDGDWITANRTTLGADNGVGLAASLALMEETGLIHGPLEILVTVEEETGLSGAAALEPDFIQGRMLLNLDSEEDGVFCVGCAGGLDTITTVTTERVPSKKSLLPFEVQVAGLRGGHSGGDILKNRGNALVLTARVLKAISDNIDIDLSWFIGGDKHNAIPREAFATVLLLPSQEARLFEILNAVEGELQEEFGASEPNLRVSAKQAAFPSSVLSKQSTTAVIAATLAFPNGVLSMMRDMKEVVETSNNLAKIRCEETAVTFLNSSRSSVRAALNGTAAKIEAVASLLGGRCERISGYPGWKPDMQSPLLSRGQQIWQKVHGSNSKVEVIHAGLECGIIGEKLPGMDMISLGPTIQNPHSPAERVSISSVERFYTFVKAFIEDIAAGGC